MRLEVRKLMAVFHNISPPSPFPPPLPSQTGEAFTDPDFPPATVSLYPDPQAPSKPWRVEQWLRPRDIVDPHSSRSTRWEVFRNPRPEDITQGVLGNCW